MMLPFLQQQPSNCLCFISILIRVLIICSTKRALVRNCVFLIKLLQLLYISFFVCRLLMCKSHSWSEQGKCRPVVLSLRGEGRRVVLFVQAYLCKSWPSQAWIGTKIQNSACCALLLHACAMLQDLVGAIVPATDEDRS